MWSLTPGRGTGAYFTFTARPENLWVTLSQDGTQALAKPLIDRAFSGCASSPEYCSFRSQFLLRACGILDGRQGFIFAFSRAITPEGR